MSRSKRPQFADEVLTATGGEIKRFLPSHIRVDHAANQRWAPYDTPEEIREWIGPRCCFTLAQIEKRLASLLSEGQLEDITVTISNTGYPDLAIGFLRHAAFLLAEARGLLDDIPGAKGIRFSGVRAKVIPAPKTQSEHRALARKNRAENMERQDLSPVDLGFNLKRALNEMDDEGRKPSSEEVAAEFGISKRTLDRYLQLTTLAPEVLLAVHEGRKHMSAALSEASQRGAGSSRGPNSGIQRKAMRRRARDARPETPLNPMQVDALIDLINGDVLPTDVDDTVRAWIAYVNPPPPPKQSTKPKKKAPPKPGQQSEVGE